MRSMFFSSLLGGLAICLSFMADAQSKSGLKVGDPAPPLAVWKWAKGKPVPAFEKGKLYLVEFTGTGCPPCRRAMPHLTRVAKEYAGKLTVISVFDGMEDTGKPEYMEVFNTLVKDNAVNMGYTIAVDKPGMVTWKRYNEGGGVPTAFLVGRDGKVVWIGHPMSMDRILAHAVDGTLTPSVLAEENRTIDGIMEMYTKVWKWRRGGQYKQAVKSIDSMLEVYKDPTHYARLVMYYLKFEVLAGNDDEAASSWLRYILSDENRPYMEGFDWDHFGGTVSGALTHKNIDLVIATYERILEYSESSYLKGLDMSDLAEAYQAKSLDAATPEDRKKYNDKAVELFGEAIELVQRESHHSETIAGLYGGLSRIRLDQEDAVKDLRLSIVNWEDVIDKYKIANTDGRYDDDIRRYRYRIEEMRMEMVKK